MSFVARKSLAGIATPHQFNQFFNFCAIAHDRNTISYFYSLR